MSDLVETVGRAIMDAYNCGIQLKQPTFCDSAEVPAELKEPECDCRKATRAAISAVLEDMMAVSKAVSEAGHDRLADDGTIEDLFRHMIAAYAKANGIEIGRRG